VARCAVVGIVLLGLLLAEHTRAQSLLLYDADARAYPLMRAKFFFRDAQGNRLRPQLGEIQVDENGIPRVVTRIDCPPDATPVPISAVLTLDVSGSMEGDGLALARTAAMAWIDAFPSGVSECAVTSFNFSNALNQDFTNDKSLLRSAVNALWAGGGTSFDAALLNPFAGALRVVARGKHRRVVVLLTDGYATGNEQAIIAEARAVNARVYCITLDSRMPDVLRNVAEQTGGQWYANVDTGEKAAAIFRGILDMAQDLAPCVIEWESGGCDLYRAVRGVAPAFAVEGHAGYAVTVDDLPGLDIAPERVLAFGAVAPGSTETRTVTLTARNAPVRITTLRPDLQLFTVTDWGGTAPPFTLQPGMSRTLRVSFTAEDSSYLICRFIMDTDACDAGFFATAGIPGRGRDRRTIRLLQPNGGEVLVAGSDTVITWEGVAPTDPVRLEYSTNGGASWIPIADNVTGLRYQWRVPRTPSDRCLARVTAALPREVPQGMVIVPAGQFLRGDQTGLGAPNERPAHTVRITTPFLMSVTEITQREWNALMPENPVPQHFGDALPVHNLTWLEAVRYCNARSRAEGLDTCYSISGNQVWCDFSRNGYRLPTEAEWEYACKAGGGMDFHTGAMTQPYCDPLDPMLDAVGWYCGNSVAPQSVGGKAANAHGLHDMHGNVAEFTWDLYTAYPASLVTDPVGENPRVLLSTSVQRGGHWMETATACRSSQRRRIDALSRQLYSGFRVVRTY